MSITTSVKRMKGIFEARSALAVAAGFSNPAHVYLELPVSLAVRQVPTPEAGDTHGRKNTRRSFSRYSQRHLLC